MARIFMTGFEAGSVQILDTPGSLSVSTAQARTGSYSLRVSAYSTPGSALLPGNPSEIYGRIGVYHESAGTGTDQNLAFVQFRDSAGSQQISVCRHHVTGFMQIYRGNTLIATGTIFCPLSTWHCFEIHLKIDNVSGEITTKIDGVEDITFSGDTQATANANVGQLLFDGNYRQSPTLYLDDIAINDTTGTVNNSWIGRGGIYGLVPSGAGTHTDFTPSAGANYAAVDEVPPDDDTTYVESDTVGHKDTYALGDLVPVSGDIQAVQWIARAKLAEAGEGNFQRLIRHDSVDYNGGDLAVDTSYAYFTEIIEKAPDDTDWTIAKVNALEAGMEVS